MMLWCYDSKKKLDAMVLKKTWCYEAILTTNWLISGTWTWTWVYLSWNCMRCSLQTSSPEPSLRGGGELVCKLHQVQFQPQCQRGAYLRVDIGMFWLKFCLFSGVLHMSTPTIKGTKVVKYSQLSTRNYWEEMILDIELLQFVFLTNASSKPIQFYLPLICY